MVYPAATHTGLPHPMSLHGSTLPVGIRPPTSGIDREVSFHNAVGRERSAMLTFNSITIAGFVGNAPKTARDREGQLSFAAFDVATSERWKDAKGNDQERTTWFHVVCNGTTARYVAGHVMKGDPVFILGTVSDKEWTDQETGEVRKAKEVRAHRVIDPTKRGTQADAKGGE